MVAARVRSHIRDCGHACPCYEAGRRRTLMDYETIRLRADHLRRVREALAASRGHKTCRCGACDFLGRVPEEDIRAAKARK